MGCDPFSQLWAVAATFQLIHPSGACAASVYVERTVASKPSWLEVVVVLFQAFVTRCASSVWLESSQSPVPT